MAEPQWLDDDALLDEMREALHSAGPITDELLAVAKGAFAWRSIDEDLMLLTLSHDSWIHEGSLVRSASTVGPRTLVFDSPDLSVELQMSRDGLIGQVIPPTPGAVVIEVRSGSRTTVRADDVGVFSVEPGPREAYRLRLELEGEPPAITDWIHPA